MIRAVLSVLRDCFSCDVCGRLTLLGVCDPCMAKIVDIADRQDEERKR